MSTTTSTEERVIDPTENVRELVTAETKRQDDLRDKQAKLFDARFDGFRDLMESRLAAIAHEFELVEGRRQEQKVDTKTAVDAALSAAKDAVKEQAAASEKAILKSETGAVEQSKANAVNFTAQLQTVNSTLSDLKDRVVKMESMKLGGTEVRDSQRVNMGLIISLIGLALSILLAAVLLSRGAGH